MELRIAPLKNFNSEDGTRLCKKCQKWKLLAEFSSRIRIPNLSEKHPEYGVPTLYYRSECKLCSLEAINNPKYQSKEAERERHRKDPRAVMLERARLRSREKNLPFNIQKSDIVVPNYCPLLGMKIQVCQGKTCRNSPTLDRIIPEKGYVKGNIMVISHRANSAKNDLSLEELELLVSNLKRVQYKEEELLES